MKRMIFAGFAACALSASLPVDAADETVAAAPQTELGVRAELASLQTIAFSEDGNRILTRDVPRFSVWDRETGKQIFATPESNEAFSWRAHLNVDGSLLAVGHVRGFDFIDNRLHLYKVDQGERIRTDPNEASSLVFSRNGRWLATGTSRLVVWDVQDPNHLKLHFTTSRAHGPLVFSDDSALCAYTYTDGRLVIANANTMEVVHEAKYNGPNRCLKFSSHSRFAMVVTDHSLHTYHLDQDLRELSARVQTLDKQMVGACFVQPQIGTQTPQVLTFDHSGKGLLWTTTGPQAPPQEIFSATDYVTGGGLAVNKDSTRALFTHRSGRDSNVFLVTVLIDLQTGERIREFKPRSNMKFRPVFSPDGTQCLVDDAGTLGLRDAQTGDLVKGY